MGFNLQLFVFSKKELEYYEIYSKEGITHYPANMPEFIIVEE
jgi:hypothetical protein